MSVEFQDFSVQVKDKLNQETLAFLEEVGGEVEAQAKQNSRVRTGKTKGSFEHAVNEGSFEVYIGSNYENAIWEEFGTGEYALEGDGRKGGWFYTDESGERHFTLGKTPNRALFNAFTSLKEAIIKEAERRFGSI
jgi:hypothetical protein